MTMPPEQITVTCPKCGRLYDTWWRPSMNLALDRFSEQYIEEMSTAICPDCRWKVPLDVLVVRPDGVWEFDPSGGALQEDPDDGDGGSGEGSGSRS